MTYPYFSLYLIYEHYYLIGLLVVCKVNIVDLLLHASHDLIMSYDMKPVGNFSINPSDN